MADNRDLDEFAKLIWGKRNQGLPLPELDLQREITPQEFANILLRAAYVQILNPYPSYETEYSEVKLIRANTGWLILNYGTAISSSSGEVLFQHGSYVESQEGAYERVCSGKGTIIAQIVNTAAEMVQIAKNELDWRVIHIVNGHPFMSWSVWKAAQDLGLNVIGYVPSIAEEAKYDRILKNCPKTLVVSQHTGLMQKPD